MDATQIAFYLNYFPCVHMLSVFIFCVLHFRLIFLVFVLVFVVAHFFFSNQSTDTDDIKCLLYVSSWNNPFFQVPRISIGITLSPPIDHGSRSLFFNLSIYMSVILIALSHAFCEVYAHTLTIPPIRVLFLFTKKQCHSVLYLSEFTWHSKLWIYKSDHGINMNNKLAENILNWLFFAGTRWTLSNSHFCLILFWKQKKTYQRMFIW